MAKKHKSHKIGKFISSILLVLILGFLFYFFVLPSFFANNKKYGTYKQENLKSAATWMSDIADSKKISAINIPGTHDTATKNVSLKYFSKCQSTTVKQQLDFGYRYLDIRLAVEEDKLKLMHGFCNCKVGNSAFGKTLYLDAVLEQCYKFLEENPSETIIFVVKKEYGDETVVEFQNILDSYVSKDLDKWYTKNQIPTLGECRGKLVLLRRYENEADSQIAGLNCLWENQGNHEVLEETGVMEKQENGVNIYVQDRYKYDTMDKWVTFVDALEKSNFSSDNTIAINFLSTNGDTSYGHPVKYAIPLNKQFWNYNLVSNTRFGWIVLDYATLELAQKVYMSNF